MYIGCAEVLEEIMAVHVHPLPVHVSQIWRRFVKGIRNGLTINIFSAE